MGLRRPVELIESGYGLDEAQTLLLREWDVGHQPCSPAGV
jgi:hypothetical protein